MKQYLSRFKTKNEDADEIIDTEGFDEIYPHLPVIMIRKSTRKLKQFIDCFSKSSVGIKIITDLMYNISKCRSEVISILVEMAKDPRRFNIESASLNFNNFVDTSNGTKFKYYNFKNYDSGVYIRNPSITINGESFLDKNETMMMAMVFESIIRMNNTEYKLQEELKTLEEKTRVFELYRKLQS